MIVNANLARESKKRERKAGVVVSLKMIANSVSNVQTRKEGKQKKKVFI